MGMDARGTCRPARGRAAYMGDRSLRGLRTHRARCRTPSHLASNNARLQPRRKGRGGEGKRERKGLIEDEDDDERYCGLRHGVRASSTAVRVDAWCDAWRNRGPGAGMLRVPTAQRFRVLSV